MSSSNSRGPRTRSVLLATGILVLGVAPLGVAATGDTLREGMRNGTATKETSIVSNNAATTTPTGGYATRQSNKSTTGGGAVYGCRSTTGGSAATPPTNPCVRANNLSTGFAFEFPMVDRDPLPFWSRGRVTLLGDAAHPMYPIGSNGASQAILDARALADQLLEHPSIGDALAAYDAARRPVTAAIVAANRKQGPDEVMLIAEQRAPQGFAHIHDVIGPDELQSIAAKYKQTAGFDRESVAQAAARRRAAIEARSA